MLRSPLSNMDDSPRTNLKQQNEDLKRLVKLQDQALKSTAMNAMASPATKEARAAYRAVEDDRDNWERLHKQAQEKLAVAMTDLQLSREAHALANEAHSTDLRVMRKELEEAQAKVNSLDQQVQVERGMRQKLVLRLEDKDRELHAVTETLNTHDSAAAEVTLQGEGAHIINLETELNALAEHNARLTEQVTNLQIQYEAERNNHNETRSLLTASEKKVADMTRELDNVLEDRRKAEEKSRDMESTVDELKKKIRDMEASSESHKKVEFEEVEVVEDHNDMFKTPESIQPASRHEEDVDALKSKLMQLKMEKEAMNTENRVLKDRLASTLSATKTTVKEEAPREEKEKVSPVLLAAAAAFKRLRKAAAEENSSSVLELASKNSVTPEALKKKSPASTPVMSRSNSSRSLPRPLSSQKLSLVNLTAKTPSPATQSSKPRGRGPSDPKTPKSPKTPKEALHEILEVANARQDSGKPEPTVFDLLRPARS